MGITSLIESSRLKQEFDVVETPDYFSPGWAIAMRHRWPVLTVLHTPLEVEARYSNLPDRTYLRLACAWERRAASLSSGFSAPSAIIREELLQIGWPVASSTVEPIGVDVADIPEEPGAIRKDRVLIVGHITPRKGHDLLARAVGRLAASRPNIEVISVGSHGMGFWGGRPFREHLEREVERSGARWTFVEHLDRSELIRLYRTCAAVAVPSRFESFSMAALEGLLASRPVLLSDRCGLVERVESGSDSGVWVTPAGDCEALASALDHVLDQVSRDPQGVGGRARASGIAIGDVDRLVPDRIALYKRVAASR